MTDTVQHITYPELKGKVVSVGLYSADVDWGPETVKLGELVTEAQAMEDSCMGTEVPKTDMPARNRALVARDAT